MAEQLERPYVDPGHVLPDEDWARVVARAREVRQEVQASAEGGAAGVGGIVLDMTALGRASRKYFPVSGIPTQLLVLHSAECPLVGGYAKSLSEWACGTVHPAPPQASWQRFVDPIHRVRLVPDELGAWAASEANTLSISWEQAGYARYTREQWLTADGRTQLEMLALDMAEVAVRDGIPARWLSDWEVRQVLDYGNRSIKGFCNHRQIDPETRTDPGDGYPYELLMERIQFYMGGTINNQGTINPEDDVALTEAQVKQLEMIPMLVEMLDNVAGGINDVPGKVLDKRLPVAGQDGVTTTLGLFLSYASADREAMLAGIREAVASIPAADLAEQINAAGIAVEIRDRLVDLIDGDPVG